MLSSHSDEIAVLDYWESVEMLTPPDLPDGADLRPPQDIEWGMSMKGDALERIQNVVLVGLFDKEAAAAECLRIIGAEDEPGRERKAPARSYLGSFRVDTSGQVVPGSFSANSYALHFERLPEFTRDTTARSEEIAANFEAKYREFMIPAHLSGGDPDTPAPMARRRMDLASINAAATWLAAQLSKSPPSVTGSGLLQKEVRSEDDQAYLLEDSFYLGDIRQVRKDVPRASRPLLEYLAGSPLDLAQHRNADDVSEIRDTLHPSRWPLGKWPGRGTGPEALVMRQQMAVNEIMRPEVVLAGVNGPPGTGKTTLLRDVIAAVVTQRAAAMCAFENPNDAFAGPVLLTLDSGPARAWQLDPSLRGFGIMVVSSNNTAVENITKKLPQMHSIADIHRDDQNAMARLDLFRPVSDRVTGGVGLTWGLISAALGNAQNRSVFNATCLGHARIDNKPSRHYSREMRDQSQAFDIVHNYANGLFDEVFCNEISGPGVWWPGPISGSPMNYSG